MIIGWGILIPIGIIASVWREILCRRPCPDNEGKFSDIKALDPMRDDAKPPYWPAAWFVLHKYGNFTGFILFIVGFATAIDMVTQDHWSFKHAKLGLAAVVMGCFQVLINIGIKKLCCGFDGLRPHGGTPLRKYWNYVHWTVGISAQFCAFYAIRTGVDLSALQSTNNAFSDNEKDAIKAWTVVAMVLILTGFVFRHRTDVMECAGVSEEKQKENTHKAVQMGDRGESKDDEPTVDQLPGGGSV
eukprot:TRINITY_DN1220_c0_g2_i2.p1 TRINITY_DN1220_c0_g2~~TRINITY_DN1220_c0_g2_i2.p1  ORF type:complete len:244 (+),score=26.63 TRINITY_DN1220_c0_g2_i2:901-1632(+)